MGRLVELSRRTFLNVLFSSLKWQKKREEEKLSSDDAGEQHERCHPVTMWSALQRKAEN